MDKYIGRATIWANTKVLFLALAACTVAAAVGIVLLQSHSAAQYHKSVQTNEMAAVANSTAMDSWGMNTAVFAQLEENPGAFPKVTPDLEAIWKNISSNLKRYREDSSVGAPTTVTARLNPIMAELEAAFVLQQEGRSLEALPLLLSASAGLTTQLPFVQVAAEEFESNAVATQRLTTLASIGVFAAALGVMGFMLWLYRNARSKVEASEAEHEILRRSEARFRPLVQHSADIIAILDDDLNVQYISPAGERVLGYSSDEMTGTRENELVHPDDSARLNAFYAEVKARPGYTGSINVRVQTRLGDDVYFEIFGNNLLHDADIKGIVLNCRDVTERHAIEQQLRHEAFHDSLTQLANRLRFTERLEHAVLRGSQDRRVKSFSVLYLDLDHFKDVNDELGHAAGDELLQEVARRLVSCVRPADTAARLGGDEFALLLDSTDTAEGARRAADRVLKEMSRPFDISGNEIRLSASIGIVLADAETISADEVIRNADLAMYDAKQNGRDCAHLYEPNMHVKLVQKLRLVNDLQHAVDADEFLVYYQPIVDLKSERITGFEALARWEHPTRGILQPSEFISLAEEVGVIQALGEKVLAEACRKAVAWNVASLGIGGLQISVNVSQKQIQKGGFPGIVKRILVESTLDPSMLVLEITESVLAANPVEVAKTLRELKALGVRIALDDFGTGFSSLNSLKHFPIDILKIDRSFTEDIDQTDKGRMLVQTVIELGTTLDLEIVAEGIERQAQLAGLNVLECGLGQGYLFAQPLDEAAADDLVARMVAETPDSRPLRAPSAA